MKNLCTVFKSDITLVCVFFSPFLLCPQDHEDQLLMAPPMGLVQLFVGEGFVAKFLCSSDRMNNVARALVSLGPPKMFPCQNVLTSALSYYTKRRKTRMKTMGQTSNQDSPSTLETYSMDRLWLPPSQSSALVSASKDKRWGQEGPQCR